MNDDPKPSHWWPPPEHPPDELLPDPTFKETFQRWWRQGLAYWIFAAFSLIEGGLMVFILGFVGKPDVMHEDGAIRHGSAMFQEPPQNLFWFPLGFVLLVGVVVVAHLSFLKYADRIGWSPEPRGLLVNGFYCVVISLILGWASGTGERLVNRLWMVSHTDRTAFVTESDIFTGLSKERKKSYARVILLHYSDGTKRVLLDDRAPGPIKAWDCVRYREGIGILGVPFARRPFRRRAMVRIDCPDSLLPLIENKRHPVEIPVPRLDGTFDTSQTRTEGW